MRLTKIRIRKVVVVDFYIDIGVAVLLRVLKDRRRAPEYFAVFRKVYNAIGRALVPGHVDAEESTMALPKAA